jgi:hypothetical protein
VKSKHTYMHHEIDYLLLPSDERKRKRRRREKKGMSWALYECSFSLSNYVSLLYLPFIFFLFSPSLSLSPFVCWWSNVCLDR